jgi:hypothetical protein
VRGRRAAPRRGGGVRGAGRLMRASTRRSRELYAVSSRIDRRADLPPLLQKAAGDGDHHGPGDDPQDPRAPPNKGRPLPRAPARDPTWE